MRITQEQRSQQTSYLLNIEWKNEVNLRANLNMIHVGDSLTTFDNRLFCKVSFSFPHYFRSN